MSYFQQIAVDGVTYEIALPHKDTDYIQRKINQDASPYELGMLLDMVGRLSTDDMVLDVGANIGNHSLFLAAAVGCKVHAFEPNVELCDALRESIARNKFDAKIIVHCVGVGKEPAKARFANTQESNLGAQSLAVERGGVGEIDVIRLDDVAFDEPIRAMKIDVEGMELAVLEGAAKTIRRDRPTLYIECQTEQDFIQVQAWLAPYGYCYWETFNATPTHLFIRSEDVSDGQRIERLMTKVVRDEYRLEKQIKALSSSLEHANGKYRNASEQIATLKEQLHAANLKYRDATDHANHLKREVDTLREANRRELKQSREHHEAERRSFRETEEALKKRLHVVNLKYRNITHQLDTLRRSRAYKMATHVGQAIKSPAAAIKLPWRMLNVALQTAQPAQTSLPQAPAATSIIAEATPTVVDGPPKVSEQPTTWLFERTREQLKSASARRLRVACIMDEFTYHSYLPECDLHALTPGDWENELNTGKPDFLLIESAWRGKDESWGSKVGHASHELQSIIAWCRERGVPSVFWNKEDPVHFQTFLNTASLFDFVFTTDIDCIHRYKGALGHDRVYLLPFACQPRLNNPIEIYERKDAFCFAGAYYARYPSRTRDLDNFVSTLSDYRPLEIYDRNYGKDHPDYQFPDQYQPYIVGTLPFDQIDKAYKGYRYAINLNSINQSQTMFARRVFELLASNTITASNYSRGVRLLFGDLVVTSNEGSEIIRKLEAIAESDSNLDKFRLAALRKVMREHTYEDRLAYIVAKLKGEAMPDLLPVVTLVGYASTSQEAQVLVDHFRRQSYDQKQLVVVTAHDVAHEIIADGRIRFVPETEAARSISTFTGKSEWIAGLVAEDYYGPNYLIDLALATRYSDADVITKRSYYVVNELGGIEHVMPHAEYRYGDTAARRAALARRCCIANQSLGAFAASIRDAEFKGLSILAIDRFNYCRNGLACTASPIDVQKTVNDLAPLNEGLSFAKVIDRAERIEPQQRRDDRAPVLSGNALASMFKPVSHKSIRLSVSGEIWEVESSLPDGTHDYIYAARSVTPAEWGYDGNIAAAYLEVEPGLNVQLVMMFLDSSSKRISAVVRPANKNNEIQIPQGTSYIKLGIRVYGSGSTFINGLVLGHRQLQPTQVMGRSRYLLLTNHYPTYDSLYRNGFVHSRVKAYKERGVDVDVFRLRTDEPLSYHEFEDVDVITGSQEALSSLISGGNYEHVLVHFLDPNMWTVLSEHIHRLRVTVWVHGAEIQPYHRREYNFTNDKERSAAKHQSNERLAFWRGLLQPMPVNLKLVFVSRYFAEEVMEDLGFRLPDRSYEIIHNPIDTDLFAYKEKPAQHRLRLLSIRPYETRKYANDLTVEALLLLRDKPWFSELEIKLIGDGKLFDETLAKLRDVKNVDIERRFLTQGEISELHRAYGVFLTPTRMDAQGVSRDEAMSSGLVPVTNAVAAIPEFVDTECGVLAPAEDAQAMADGIEALYHDPDLFLKLSENAARRVRGQSAKTLIIDQELAQFVTGCAVSDQTHQGLGAL
ncbi:MULTISPECIES: FkbM family methyltransferase [unclassified Aminobacter]|uniref:FkbM family methyltransferase n=1 Tax=unclassified Aminobacter TaxID=2644704 RepID=UPI0004671A83|nr:MULTISPECIES: FkbM family methyltransferase [unclassified Aminobacter]TWH28751.1 FkbM family methyltransferase [Aminobacter sp. J15]